MQTLPQQKGRHLDCHEIVQCSLFTTVAVHIFSQYSLITIVHHCSQYSQLFTIFTTVQYYAKLTSWHKCSTVQEVMLSSHHQQSIISSSASKEVNRHHQQHLPDLQGVFFLADLLCSRGRYWPGREEGVGKIVGKDCREELSEQSGFSFQFIYNFLVTVLCGKFENSCISMPKFPDLEQANVIK